MPNKGIKVPSLILYDLVPHQNNIKTLEDPDNKSKTEERQSQLFNSEGFPISKHRKVGTEGIEIEMVDFQSPNND